MPRHEDDRHEVGKRAADALRAEQTDAKAAVSGRGVKREMRRSAKRPTQRDLHGNRDGSIRSE